MTSHATSECSALNLGPRRRPALSHPQRPRVPDTFHSRLFFNVTDSAAQFSRSWNSGLWERVGSLLRGESDEPPLQPYEPPRQRQVRLSPDRAAMLVADYAAGDSREAVAARYGVHVETATRHITKAGLKVRRPHGIPANELPTARALYNQGWTYKEIGANYGTSRTTVSNQLNGRP